MRKNRYNLMAVRKKRYTLDKLEKRIEELEEHLKTVLDLLDYEYEQCDGMPEEAVEPYRKACNAIGRYPGFDAEGPMEEGCK